MSSLPLAHWRCHHAHQHHSVEHRQFHPHSASARPPARTVQTLSAEEGRTGSTGKPNVLFGPRSSSHPVGFNEDPPFLVFRALNDPAAATAVWQAEQQSTGPIDNSGTGMLDSCSGTSSRRIMTNPGARRRLSATLSNAWFPDTSSSHQLARALADVGAVDVKELFEAMEFYERVRKRVRAPVMIDVACGHGLAGIVFAALERRVERVVLIDTRCPPSHHTVMAAALTVAPWVRDKVHFVTADVAAVARELQARRVAGLGGRQQHSASPTMLHCANAVRASLPDGGLGTGGPDNERLNTAGIDGLDEASMRMPSRRRRLRRGRLAAAYSAAGEQVSTVDPQGDATPAHAAHHPSLFAAGECLADVLPDAAASAGASADPASQLSGPRSTPRCGVIAIHACGSMTDTALAIACELQAPVAVMPCCYSGMAHGAPFGVRRALGVSMAADIDRSYRMQAAGFEVDWSAIPRVVTPMNRILIATRRK